MESRYNADFDRPVLVRTRELPWQPSPTPGVERRPLDRIGAEVARATSLVRYARGSSFPTHTHGGGEEILVLEGTFEDESGSFPAGTYLRNPPGTSHAPGSEGGCVIFVKLWQFDADDDTEVRRTLECEPGLEQVLHEDERERVVHSNWQPGEKVLVDVDGGQELLVLEGSLEIEHEGQAQTLDMQDWLRLPLGIPLVAAVGEQGCRVWHKSGHLRFVAAPQP